MQYRVRPYIISFASLFILVGFLTVVVFQTQVKQRIEIRAAGSTTESKKFITLTIIKDEKGKFKVINAEVNFGFNPKIFPPNTTHELQQVQNRTAVNKTQLSFSPDVHTHGPKTRQKPSSFKGDFVAYAKVPYVANATYKIKDKRSGIVTNLVLPAPVNKEISKYANKNSTIVRTPATTTQVTRKVLVLNYDPSMILNGLDQGRVTQYFGWNDPQTLENAYISEISALRCGGTNYQIAERRNINEFPQKLDGFRYTPETFKACQQDASTCHMPDNVDYNKIFEDQRVCEKINSGQADEVWIWGAPYFGYWEANMAGVGAYETNGPVITNTSCNRPVHVMGFAYHEGFTNMMHDMGHRTEGTVRYVTGQDVYSYNGTPRWPPHPLGGRGFDFGPSGCGITHGYLNVLQSPGGYVGGGNTTDMSYRESICPNYPNSGTSIINCNWWGCNPTNFLRMWLSKIPQDWWGKGLDVVNPLPDGGGWCTAGVAPLAPTEALWAGYRSGSCSGGDVDLAFRPSANASSYTVKIDQQGASLPTPGVTPPDLPVSVNCANPSYGDFCYTNIRPTPLADGSGGQIIIFHPSPIPRDPPNYYRYRFSVQAVNSVGTSEIKESEYLMDWQTGICPSVTPTPTSAPHLVFVTSQTYDGNLGGLAGADNKCQARAVAAGLPGTFKAWLSTQSPLVHAKDRIPDVPYRRVDGALIANNKADLLDSSIQTHISVDETGSPQYAYVYTGTGADGINSFSTCNNWTNNTSSQAGRIGASNVAHYGWTATSYRQCNNADHLYCFQTDRGPQPTPSPTPVLPVYKVFVSSVLYNGNLGGLIGADAKCQMLANSVVPPLPGTYKAYLSDSSTNAKDRISNGVYVGTTGYVVARSLTDLTDGFLENYLNRTETGDASYATSNFTQTGTDAWGNKTAHNCNDWLSSSTSVINTYGKMSTDPYWASYSTQDCAKTIHIYCFQTTN